MDLKEREQAKAKTEEVVVMACGWYRAFAAERSRTTQYVHERGDTNSNTTAKKPRGPKFSATQRTHTNFKFQEMECTSPVFVNWIEDF